VVKINKFEVPDFDFVSFVLKWYIMTALRAAGAFNSIFK
jgi:hypothetical protein